MPIQLKRPKGKNNDNLVIRAPESLKQQIAIQAEKEDRIFSDMARILLCEAIEARKKK